MTRPRARLLTPLVLAGALLLGATPAVAQQASPSPSPTPSLRYPSPNCPSYELLAPTPAITAGEPVKLRAVITGNGNDDHDVRVTPQGYTRRPEVVTLESSSFTREPGGGLPDGEGRTYPHWSFRPTTSSRVWIEYADRCHDGQQRTGETERVMVAVAPYLTLTAVRNGPRDYTFSGQAVSRPGHTVSLYRVEADGREVLTARTASTAAGTWSLQRRFLGSGRFGFVARTTTDLANAAGVSSTRPTVIH